jgi:hypothetical protein
MVILVKLGGTLTPLAEVCRTAAMIVVLVEAVSGIVDLSAMDLLLSANIATTTELAIEMLAL